MADADVELGSGVYEVRPRMLLKRTALSRPAGENLQRSPGPVTARPDIPSMRQQPPRWVTAKLEKYAKRAVHMLHDLCDAKQARGRPAAACGRQLFAAATSHTLHH